MDHRPSMPTILTSDGHILSPQQVAEHLKRRFETEEFQAAAVNKTIKKVVVLYSPTAEIVRPQPDHTYDSMPGMKKTFLFMPVREGVTLQRSFACWCNACMHAWAPGEGSMDSNYACKGCCSPDLKWRETSIGRTDAAGVSNARRRSLGKARELTKQLQAHFGRSSEPIWVAVQNRGEDDPDQYWIGRALRVEKVYTEPGSIAGSAGRVRYDVGDCEIAVQWFQRDVSGASERRTFKVWAEDEEAGDAGPADGNTYTFNSTELRLINTPSAAAGAIQLEMRPLPPVGAVPLNIVQRASSRLAQVPRPNYRNVAYQACEQRAPPPQQLYEISTGSERAVLDNCW